MKSKSKYLIILTLIYVVLFVIKKVGLYAFLISDYAADLLCLPVTFLFTDFLIDKIPRMKFKINLNAALIAVIYFSLVFEVLMPSLSSNYTADAFDVLCYLSGAIFYLYFFKERELSKTF